MNGRKRFNWPFGNLAASCAFSLVVIGHAFVGVGLYFGSQAPPPNPLPVDDKSAKAQILAWIPIGTSLENAEASLNSHKFVWYIAHEKDGSENLVGSINGPGWITCWEWVLAFKIEQGRVIDLSVHAEIMGP